MNMCGSRWIVKNRTTQSRGFLFNEYSVVAKSERNNIRIYEGYGTGVLD